MPSQEVIAYCQVGMRASVDLFALHLIGYDKLRNYYGAGKSGAIATICRLPQRNEIVRRRHT